MKRILPIFLSLSLAPVAYAQSSATIPVTPRIPAVPATSTTTVPSTPATAPTAVAPTATAPTGTAPTPTPIPDPNPVMDPGTSELITKSQDAYKALSGLSLHFESSRLAEGKTSKSSGDLSFTRPDKGRIETKSSGGPILGVADGTKFWLQVPTKPVSYIVNDLKGSGVVAVAGRVNNYSGLPFNRIVQGDNYLKLGYIWETVSMLPGNAVKMVGHVGHKPNPPRFIFTLTFDPATSLLQNAEVSATIGGKTAVTKTVFSQVVANPEVKPELFAYTPGPKMKVYVEPPPFDPKLVVGSVPFALKGMDLQANRVSLKDYKGKVVLIDFWATWCGPCVGEMPNVLANYEKYRDQGFDIIGVSLDDDRNALNAFVADHNLKYPNIYDGRGWDNKTATKYGIHSIPFSLLIGKDGKIAAVEPRAEALEPAIVAALDGRSTPTPAPEAEMKPAVPATPVTPTSPVKAS